MLYAFLNGEIDTEIYKITGAIRRDASQNRSRRERCTTCREGQDDDHGSNKKRQSLQTKEYMIYVKLVDNENFITLLRIWD